MKSTTTFMSLILASSFVWAQPTSTKTQGEAECLPCMEAAKSRQQTEDLNRIYNATKASNTVPGAQKVIKEMAEESELSDAEDSRDEAMKQAANSSKATLSARAKDRISITIPSGDVFDQQSADEIARAMALRGLRNTTVVDVYLLRERDAAERAEVLARLRKALKTVCAPLLKEAKENLKENFAGVKAKLKNEAGVSTSTAKANDEDQDKDPDKKSFNAASGIAESVRINGLTSVIVQLYGNSDPQTTRYIGLVKEKGLKPQLEARYGTKTKNNGSYGVSANISRQDGRNNAGAFVYWSAPLNADFTIAK